AAISRGTIVSSGSSSADSITTFLGGRLVVVHGYGAPVVSRAARSAVSIDLPSPGSPANNVGLPAQSTPSHSGSSGRGVISAARRIRGSIRPTIRSGRPAPDG